MKRFREYVATAGKLRGNAMLILGSPELTTRIADSRIRELVEVRFAQILNGEPYDRNRHGYMIVVEPGDSVKELEEASGCPILSDSLGETSYGDPEFAPATEAMEERVSCYELVFILSDDGAGVEIFVPKVEGVDPELLAMCATHAVPTEELSST